MNDNVENGQLRKVDLSLEEFLGAPWKGYTQLRTNANVLALLLTVIPEVATVAVEKVVVNESTSRRQPNSHFESMGNARFYMLMTGRYLHAVKFTFPKIWYTCYMAQLLASHSVHPTIEAIASTKPYLAKVATVSSNIVSTTTGFLLWSIVRPSLFVVGSLADINYVKSE
eukprot:CAMPEP_0197609356 /NCGR_PEP_ID=MMETSP1326-20131121/51058_1 /TAXON_ID=1155430 /ORGANISM="Genus nov. species nov., Strain RCC2288" /LENGTH=169 /DNA_ID=CAMNT_0043177717 /DNA_START=112 /DNA_END=618 /DNA_ORIENTATION=-